MGSLVNKRIVLGVSGGIAAYKSPDVVRRLRDAGAEVQVVMTAGALAFITELTLQAVSGRAVRTRLLDTEAEAAMGHIELARWADAVLIAPASADFLARLQQGRADDLLTALCLATDAPLAVAPAMNHQMWSNAGTQATVRALQERGVHIFGPGEGDQACGETGPGRMLEAVDLAARAADLFETGALAGLSVVVTAGPTWEAIDPVRGITNRSSGKMGYAVATAAAEAGARVTLVSGPTHLPDPARLTTVRVVSAQEMHDAVQARVGEADIFIGVAAVADYRPRAAHARKLKKDADTLTLELVRCPDILAAVAARRPAPFTVGFAAETQDLEAQARAKLIAKGVDLIAANRVGAGEGFDAEKNRLLLIDGAGVVELPLQSKPKLARGLIHYIAKKYYEKNPVKDSRQAHR